MMRLIVDSELQAKLTESAGPLEICDQAGQTIGYFSPASRLKDLSPFSDEDIEQFSKQGEGRPLADIWRDLKGRHGT